jgi:hypothetical protein
MARLERLVFFNKSSLTPSFDCNAIQVMPSSFAASARASKTILSEDGRSSRQTAVISEMLMTTLPKGLRD